jgi:hypothetical protein
VCEEKDFTADQRGFSRIESKNLPLINTDDTDPTGIFRVALVDCFKLKATEITCWLWFLNILVR